MTADEVKWHERVDIRVLILARTEEASGSSKQPQGVLDKGSMWKDPVKKTTGSG